MMECVLCGKVQKKKPNGKLTIFPRHHIDYDEDITIQLCYSCHMLIHGRLRFRSPWETKYGKDKAFYELSKAFIELYDKYMLGK